MMSPTKFWKLIVESRKEANGDVGGQTAALKEILERHTPEEIVAFDERFQDLMDLSDREELWAAAYLINGGCSDDGFEYFRRWLIAQGEKVFGAALANPDSLAGVVEGEDGELECEEIAYVARDVHIVKTGADIPEGKPEDEDNDFDDDEFMKRLLPKLWALCGPAEGREG